MVLLIFFVLLVFFFFSPVNFAIFPYLSNTKNEVEMDK